MKTDNKNKKKNEPKKKIGRIELIMNTPINPAFRNLHLLLEPHEIPLHNSK